MKRFVPLLALAAALLASGSAAFAAEQTVTLAVGNMTCVSCPVIVKKALSAVPGVIRAEVSYKDKAAVVTFDDRKASVEALIDAATNAGYPSKLTAVTSKSQ